MTTSSTAIRCDDVMESLPAFALGALDGDESILVGEHLAACPACRAELAKYDAVVDQLNVTTPVIPPASLRDRVLASAGSASAVIPMPTPTGEAPSELHSGPLRFSRRRVVTIGLATAASLLIAAVAVLAALLSDARESRDEAAATEQQLASYLSSGGQVTAMASLSAANYGYSFGQGSLVTAPGKAPLIVVGGCPKSDDDREYRVWLERDGDRIRVGILNVGEEGSGWLTFEPPEPLSSYDAIGVTMVTDDDVRNDLFVGATAQSTS
jgi:hypothetical protein